MNPAKLNGRTIALLICLAIGAAMIGVIGPGTRADTLDFLTYLGFTVGMLGLIGATLAIHEAGHLLAGLAVGHSFSWVNIAGLVITHDGSRYKVRFVKWSSEMSHTFMVCRRSLPSVARKRIEILGGLVASWAYFLVLAHYVSLPGDYQFNTREALVSSVALLCSIMSGGLLFAIFIDFFSGNQRNDYRRLLNSLIKRDLFKRELAFEYMACQLRDGVLARDWPVEVMAQLAVPADGSAEEAASRYLHYYHFADRGETQAAWDELLGVIDIVDGADDSVQVKVLRDLLPHERLFAACRLLKDPELVERYKGIPHELTMEGRASYARARAAFALWEKRPEHALLWVARSREALDEVQKGASQCANDRVWLDEMEAEAKTLVS